jgi:hypothetical protein
MLIILLLTGRLKPSSGWVDTYVFTILLRGTGFGVVCHERRELESVVRGLIRAWERNALWRRRAAADDVEIEAVIVELGTGKGSVCQILHVTVQGDYLGSQHVCSCLDVAWDLDFEAVIVVCGNFVGPFVCYPVVSIFLLGPV